MDTCFNDAFVSLIEPAGGSSSSIRGLDGAVACLAQTYWDGPRAPGYSPMKKQGAIVLGLGGDNSDGAVYASRTPHSLQHLVDLASWRVQGDVL